MILGTTAADPYVAVVLISLAAASSNLLLAPAWGTAVDLGGMHSGVVSAVMNTSGCVSGFFSPIVVGYVVQNYGNWNLPLYITGSLYLLGALCWFGINPKPLAAEAS
jgi:fucose permease